MSRYHGIDFELTENFAESLDGIAREGARRMLISVLEQEVEGFLGRKRYERGDVYEGYRSGHGKGRKVATGSGTVDVRVPRIRDSEKPFRSRVLRTYQRQSDDLKRLIPELYLHGLATGDFDLALRGFWRDGASLPASSVARLKEHCEAEYEDRRKRWLEDHRYAYFWCDGVYPKAGLVGDKTALLVVMSANRDGRKEPLAIIEDYRESAESWGEVLRDLKVRGLDDPRLFVGDGALGLWAAIRGVYPEANEQRCWVHRKRNVLSYFPKRLQDEVKIILREVYYASDGEKAVA